MRIIEYIKDTKAEMANVKWPTKNQAINYTTVVILVSIITAGILGAFDVLFTKFISFIAY